jgi:preprotein translocase subunit SecE
MLIRFIKKQNSIDIDRQKLPIAWRVTFMKRLTEFFRNVGREMRKVSWPKRKELTKYTIVVISTVIIMSVFFAVIDLGISELIRLVIE